MTIKRPEPLDKHHDVTPFCCKHPELDHWLKKYAFQAKAAGSANTFVVLNDTLVIGYYSLTVGHVELDQVSDRIKKGMGKYPIPVVVLARLAVHHEFQGKGIGQGMLKDAVLRTLQLAAEHVGVRAILVHAIDDAANNFYQKFGFEPSPVRENQLLLLLKDAQKIRASHKKSGMLSIESIK